jgi:nucleotide-binding universal stress UspA family protein
MLAVRGAARDRLEDASDRDHQPMREAMGYPPRADARPTPSIPARPDRRIGAIVNSQATPLVVGVDGTERSRDALALAAQLADSDQRVLLTHVHPYGRLANLLSDGQYEVLVRDVADATFAAVQETLAPAAQRELRLVSNSSPAAGLQLIAEETGASIIVVGSSHRSGLDRVRAGSVTESVLAGAPVPVAVAPRAYSGTDRALRTIGCGFDGSPESEWALAWAADLARRRGADLLALAVHTPVAFGGVSTGSAFGHRSANDALRAALVEQLNDAVTTLGDRSEISGRVLEGDAASELAGASAELDLLVLGSRGYGPIRTVLLGSVSRALVRSSACPVVVLPRGAPVEPHAEPAAS